MLLPGEDLFVRLDHEREGVFPFVSIQETLQELVSVQAVVLVRELPGILFGWRQCPDRAVRHDLGLAPVVRDVGPLVQMIHLEDEGVPVAICDQVMDALRHIVDPVLQHGDLRFLHVGARVEDQAIHFSEVNTMLNSSAVVGLSIPALGTPERDTVRITLLDKIISANLVYLDAMQKKLDQEFDDRPFFMPLINSGWLERISTTSVKKSISKNTIIENVSNNIWRFPLHVQYLNPCHSWDRAFITGDDWPQINA